MRLIITGRTVLVPDASRSGRIGYVLIFALPALMLIGLVPINSFLLHAAKTQQHSSNDASVLAATLALVNDLRLKHPPEMTELFTDALEQAREFSKKNPVRGVVVEIRENPDNNEDGDFVLGAWSGTEFDSDIDLSDPISAATVDAVKVRFRRRRERNNALGLLGGGFLPFPNVNMETSALAVFDRRVRGFRAVEGRNIPMTPVALLSDPAGTDHRSWQYQVEFARLHDDFRWDAENKVFVEGESDGIFEMHVTFGGVPADDDLERRNQINAVLLQIGTSELAPFTTACRQLVEGISEEELEDFNGEIVLDDNGKRVLPGTPFFEREELFRDCLRAITATSGSPKDEPRVWPLFAGTENDMPVIRGFVAGRVAKVLPAAAGQGVTFIIQATVLSTATAVNDEDLVNVNRYVGRVRLRE